MIVLYDDNNITIDGRTDMRLVKMYVHDSKPMAGTLCGSMDTIKMRFELRFKRVKTTRTNQH